MTPVDDNGPELTGDDALAAEYVLGVLPADERQNVARRIDDDPAFARLVDSWEVRLSPMASAYEEVAPPQSVKAALERRIFGQPPAAAAPGGLWESLAFWRGLTVAALAALLVVAAIPFLTPEPTDEGPAPRLVASLADDGTDVHYFVVYDAARNEVGLSHVSGERDSGRDFELWVIEGEDPPASLGVIPVGANVRLAVADALQRKVEAGAVFAISLEPEGGSPTGAPTGPVVAAGDLKTI